MERTSLLTSISRTAGLVVWRHSLQEHNYSLKSQVASFSSRESSIFITLPIHTHAPPVLLMSDWVFPLQVDQIKGNVRWKLMSLTSSPPKPGRTTPIMVCKTVVVLICRTRRLTCIAVGSYPTLLGLYFSLPFQSGPNPSMDSCNMTNRTSVSYLPTFWLSCTETGLGLLRWQLAGS